MAHAVDVRRVVFVRDEARSREIWAISASAARYCAFSSHRAGMELCGAEKVSWIFNASPKPL